MERWFKVTARVEDGSVREWLIEGHLAVYRLLCEQFEYIGDTWEEVIEPEFDCELSICEHQNFVIREGVVVMDSNKFFRYYLPCEIVIEKIDPPKPEKTEYMEAKNVRSV